MDNDTLWERFYRTFAEGHRMKLQRATPREFAHTIRSMQPSYEAAIVRAEKGTHRPHSRRQGQTQRYKAALKYMQDHPAEFE